MTEWIKCSDRPPDEGDYVYIYVDGYIGISRFIEGEWDTGEFRRRPMFNKTQRIMSKLEASHWMPLHKPPVED